MRRLSSFLSGSNTLERLSLLSVLLLWLYLFSPFRILCLPILFGQPEEWTLSFILLSLSGVLLIASFYRKKREIIRITVSNILVLLYLIYILFRLNEYLTEPLYILSLLTLLFLYWTICSLHRFFVRFMLPVLAFSILFQVFHFFYKQGFSFNNVSSVVGVFNNTGLWGGFISIVCVGLIGLLFFSKRNKIILTVMALFIIGLLISSQSRAAWVGTFGGICFLTIFFFWKRYGSRIFLPFVVILLISLPVLIFVGNKMYLMKSVSADGRVYIWKISSQMIKENPFWGMGIDKFKSKYMFYQADFFSKNPDSPFAQMAGEINVPFCDPLKIAIEQGIIGLALFLSVLLSAFFHQRGKITNPNAYAVFTAILITMLLFSCFSYPFLYIQFSFLFIACITILSRLQTGCSFSISIGKRLLIGLIPCLAFICYFCFAGIKNTASLKRMQNELHYFNSDNTTNTMKVLASLEAVLQTNPYFLVSYANIFSKNNENNRSIALYKKSLMHHVSYSVYLELGRVYEQSGETDSALKCWEIANRMIPSRFEPLYLQIGSYHNSDNYSRADSLTAIFLQKERKWETLRIDRMLRDVRQWERERKQ